MNTYCMSMKFTKYSLQKYVHIIGWGWDDSLVKQCTVQFKKRIITNFTIKMMHDYKHDDCMLSPSGVVSICSFFAIYCIFLDLYLTNH